MSGRGRPCATHGHRAQQPPPAPPRRCCRRRRCSRCRAPPAPEPGAAGCRGAREGWWHRRTPSWRTSSGAPAVRRSIPAFRRPSIVLPSLRPSILPSVHPSLKPLPCPVSPPAPFSPRRRCCRQRVSSRCWCEPLLGVRVTPCHFSPLAGCFFFPSFSFVGSPMFGFALSHSAFRSLCNSGSL